MVKKVAGIAGSIVLLSMLGWGGMWIYFDRLARENSPAALMGDCIDFQQRFQFPPPPPNTRDQRTFWGILEISPYSYSWTFKGDLCYPRPPKNIGRLKFVEYAGREGPRYAADDVSPSVYLGCLSPASKDQRIVSPMEFFLRGPAVPVTIEGYKAALIREERGRRLCQTGTYFYQLICKHQDQLILLTMNDAKSEKQAKAYLFSAASILLKVKAKR